MKTEPNKFSRVVKSLRTRQEISQMTLAKKLGYDNSQPISNFERGLHGLPLKKVAKLCRALNMAPATARKLLLDDYSDEISAVLK